MSVYSPILDFYTSTYGRITGNSVYSTTIYSSSRMVRPVWFLILTVDMFSDHGLRIAQTIKSNFRECDYTPIGMRMENEQIYFVELGEDEEEEIILNRNRPIDIAIAFLEEKLADGPIESNEIKELLADEGISERTANRAKKALGIESVRENGVTFWELP